MNPMGFMVAPYSTWYWSKIKEIPMAEWLEAKITRKIIR
jgi:hypothetical protein